MPFKDEFINEISKLNPSSNVTDENANIPTQELEHNLKFLLNLLSVSSASSPNLLSLIYGNLLDYDTVGTKVFFNGGNMDCFEKKNAWLAIDDGAVVNDTQIQSTGGANNLLVYRGAVSSVDDAGEHGRWLQREFYIPPLLRGSELIFAIKGTGVNTLMDQTVAFDYEIPFCNSSLTANISAVGLPGCISSSGTSGTPACGTCDTTASCTSGTSATSACGSTDLTNCYGRYEDIGIDVIGADSTVQVIKTIGPWPHHKFYAEQPSWKPEYRTVAVSFKVGKNTDSIKIRIRRTRSDGVIAISQMLLGGLPQPFADFDIAHLDINELYNFNSGLTKWNVTDVNGRHVAQDSETSKLPNLLTKEQFLHLVQFNKNLDKLDYYDHCQAPEYDMFFSTETGAPSAIPPAHGFKFCADRTSYLYYNVNVDGPSPGMCYFGISYFTNSCCPSASDVCTNIKLNLNVAVVNSGDSSNLDSLPTHTFAYTVPVPNYALNGKMGYVELYGDFYQDLLNTRGNIVYVTLSREGLDDDDTFDGNFIVVGFKTGIAVPPDDIPDSGSYDNLFVGDNNSC